MIGILTRRGKEDTDTCRGRYWKTMEKRVIYKLRERRITMTPDLSKLDAGLAGSGTMRK
jgi:hypothetical protein